MKCICKQCGTTFELSESEIAFYRKKNLNLPKRCKECREENKQKQAGSVSNREFSKDLSRYKTDGYKTSGYKMSSGLNGNQRNKWILALLVVLALLIIGGVKASRMAIMPEYAASAETLQSENPEKSDLLETSLISEDQTEKISQDDGNDSAVALQHEIIDSTKSQQYEDTESPEALQNAADESAELKELTDAADTETSQSVETDTVESQSVENAGGRQYVFRNEDRLNEHFEKHGIEMGFATAQEYQAAASAVVNNANALHKLEAEDNDDVYYVQESNEFVIVSPDGYIRTYFCPNDGINYYNRQ